MRYVHDRLTTRAMTTTCEAEASNCTETFSDPYALRVPELSLSSYALIVLGYLLIPAYIAIHILLLKKIISVFCAKSSILCRILTGLNGINKPKWLQPKWTSKDKSKLIYMLRMSWTNILFAAIFMIWMYIYPTKYKIYAIRSVTGSVGSVFNCDPLIQNMTVF
eukprot:639638_1